MDGVTILSQRAVDTGVINMTAFWIAFWITASLLCFGVICAIKYSEEWIMALWFIVVPFVAMLFGILFGTACGHNEFAYTEYKVTIDESTSMTEFYEKYEVIDQEGLIFTVREKHND